MTPAALGALCPGCGHRSGRAPGGACPDCGLPHRMHRWVDSLEDDASGAVGASLLSAGLVGAAVIAATVGHGLGGDTVAVAWLASPLLALGGWGVRELHGLRGKTPGQSFRSLEQSDPRGDFWWVEATVQLDEAGRVQQGQGRSRRSFRRWPDPSPEDVPLSPDEAAALWLLASFQAESLLIFELVHEWSWSCAVDPDAAPMDGPYRGDPGLPTWEHRGQRQVHVRRDGGLEPIVRVSRRGAESTPRGSVSDLGFWGPGGLELRALVDWMLATDHGPLVATLARCRAYLEREPDSFRLTVQRLARGLDR